MNLKIIVDMEKCDSCGTCAHVCPKAGKLWDLEELRHNNGKATWLGNNTENIEYCHRCTNCLISCPKKAITVDVN